MHSKRVSGLIPSKKRTNFKYNANFASPGFYQVYQGSDALGS